MPSRSSSNALGVSAQQKLSLLLVEDPDEILVVRHEGHERGGLDVLAAASR